MKLILLRHAKSDWAGPAMDDRDRPLNRRGREAAPRMGRWLRDNRHVPDLILCSAALRTRQTCEGLGLTQVATEYRDDLYLAPAAAILAMALHHADADTLMIVAHNPGIGEAAAEAVSRRPVHPDFGRYPTCACTVIDAEAGLPGPPLAFVVPRDLPA